MAVLTMKDVLEGLRDAINASSIINVYNDIVTFEQLTDTGVPVAGEFRSHCVNLWPVGEPEEEERIGKYTDIRFDVEVTAFCKKGAADAHSFFFWELLRLLMWEFANL
mgnify:CR=1 FL=1